MVDFSFELGSFITILDYLGTIAFAVTGASKAIAHRADIFGIIVLATVVGVAGGITRDVTFGIFPNAFSDPIYIGLTVAVGITMFFLYTKLKKRIGTWLVFDAVGLGVFSIIGASIEFPRHCTPHRLERHPKEGSTWFERPASRIPVEPSVGVRQGSHMLPCPGNIARRVRGAGAGTRPPGKARVDAFPARGVERRS